MDMAIVFTTTGACCSMSCNWDWDGDCVPVNTSRSRMVQRFNKRSLREVSSRTVAVDLSTDDNSHINSPGTEDVKWIERDPAQQHVRERASDWGWTGRPEQRKRTRRRRLQIAFCLWCVAWPIDDSPWAPCSTERNHMAKRLLALRSAFSVIAASSSKQKGGLC